MPRSNPARFLRTVHDAVRRRRTGVTSSSGPSRARFLEGLLAGGFCAAGAPAWAAAALPRGGSSRVVIVGGGAAGLTCAYRLAQAGIPSRVFEGSGALGGRVRTLRGYFADGQIAEQGGEFISTEHHAVRALCRELDLTLVDVNAAQPPGTHETYYFYGRRYTVRDAIEDYDAHVFDALHDASNAAGYPTFYNRYTRAGYVLDHTTVPQWLDANVSGGSASKIGQLLQMACLSEYGGEPAEQSALNLIYLLDGEPRHTLNLAGTDERFHVRGGNDQIISRMAARLPSASIDTNAALSALFRNANGSYTCTFSSGGSAFEVKADHVVLALPFTTLRLVDLRRAGFDALKRIAIERSSLGSNAKFHLQFTSRLWVPQEFNGTAYADTGFQTVWDSSAAQSGPAGTLVCFPGGRKGASFRTPPHGPPAQNDVAEYLRALEPVFAGVTAAFNGKAFLDHWAQDPWHFGAYSYYKRGAYTQFAGYEQVRQGNVHFCGEHTSYNFQGYINGAVVSGERAAAEVLGRTAQARQFTNT